MATSHCRQQEMPRDDHGLSTWLSSPRVLEDLIPVSLLVTATSAYLKRRWAVTVNETTLDVILRDKAIAGSLDGRIKAIWEAHGPEEKTHINHMEIRAGIVDELCEMLLFSKTLDADPSFSQLGYNIKVVCDAIRLAVDRAALDHTRELAKKRIKYHVTDFRKTFAHEATKGDLIRYLEMLLNECAGSDPLLKKARETVEQMKTDIDKQVEKAADTIELKPWQTRLSEFSANPWGPVIAVR